MRRRTRAVLAGGCLALVVAVLAVLGTSIRTGAADGMPGPAGVVGADSATAAHREMAAQQVLGDWFAAVTDRDRAAFAATLAEPDSDFGREQLRVYDRMLSLPLSHLGVRVASVGPIVGGSFVARATAQYELDGYDGGVHAYPLYVTLTGSGPAWRLTAPVTASSRSQAQPWDLPGMRVVSSPTTLVVGNVPRAVLDGYRSEVDAALPVIAATWHRSWPRRVVVVAPATVGQARSLLAASSHELDDVAAETLRDGSDGAPDATDRVVINPEAFADLTTAGRRAVLIHETTHVAVGSSLAGSLPRWLSEGIADFVGYAGAHVRDSLLDEDLVSRVRRHGVPSALPPDPAFDDADAQVVGAAYDEGRLAVRLIDRQVGSAGLTRFLTVVADADAGREDVQSATRAAFGTVLGTTEADFTRRWQDEVRRATAGR